MHSLQHDGVVIGLVGGLSAGAAARQLSVVCSDALGYEQPVEAKDM